jgi:manganese efflux pump family protein
VLSVSVIPASLMFGLVALVMTIIGVRVAPILGRIVGKGAELAGGIILIGIGIKILVDHLG